MGPRRPAGGLNGLGCAVHVVSPGRKAFPFHRHHVMGELFFVVSGEGEYRFGDTTVPVRSGDTSPRLRAHKRISSSIPAPTTCAISAFSTMGGVDVVDYPDSKKIAVAAGVKNADFKAATCVGLGRIVPPDHYDGEDS